jgi:hypothetical protein
MPSIPELDSPGFSGINYNKGFLYFEMCPQAMKPFNLPPPFKKLLTEWTRNGGQVKSLEL